MHVKSTLCYTYILELVPEKNKELCVTLITLFDESTLMIMATGLQNGNRDLIGQV